MEVKPFIDAADELVIEGGLILVHWPIGKTWAQ